MLFLNVFHLGLKVSDLQDSKIAILPGDPDRVKKIALCMENPLYLKSCREFTIWSGEIENNVIIICSTGIGGPSTSIVVEELSQLGIRIFFRVGTAGTFQDHVNVGDLLIVDSAVRYDGASQHFAPMEYPAVSDFYCTTALVKAAEKLNMRFHIGVTVSSDTFYPGQERVDTYSKRVINRLRGSMQEWKRLGVVGYEMESSTLFTMCKTQGLRAGVLVGIIVHRLLGEIPNNLLINEIENKTIVTVLESIRYLYNDDLVKTLSS